MVKAKINENPKKIKPHFKIQVEENLYKVQYLPEGRKSPRAKTNPKTTTATPTPIYIPFHLNFRSVTSAQMKALQS